MGFFKRFGRNTLLTGGNKLSFGVDAGGTKQVVIGLKSQFNQDTNFSDGTLSNYGKGSVMLDPAGGIKVVDADGYWQSFTVTAASPSVSPSHSTSPSSSGSPSGSPSSSASPSPSQSPSRSPSASGSPSASVSPSASASPST